MFSDVLADLVGCTNTQIDERIRELELRRRRLDAELAAAVAVADARMVYLDDGHRSTKAYLRATCNWSNTEATRVTRAARLVDSVDGVGDRWISGHIGTAQVAELAAARANPRIGHRLAEFAPLLLDQAEHLPFDDFRVCVNHFNTLADLDGAHRDADAVYADRTAHVTAVGTGVDISVAGGSALTTADYLAVFQRFVQTEFDRDVAARRARYGDAADRHPLPRTTQQRRHDAVHAIFLAALAAGSDGGRPRPIVDIVVDQRTAAQALARHGLSPAGTNDLFASLDQARTGRLLADADDLLQRRCETTTGIPVHPDQMLQALLTGHVRRVVIDSSGVVVDMGRLQRLFTGSARVAAQLLVRRCGHPGCQVPAALCDVDHMQPWAAESGRTDQHNGDPRCNPHDRHKHRARWRTRRAVDGRVYSIRADGTVVLPVGERCPTFFDLDDDPVEIARLERLARGRCGLLRGDRLGASGSGRRHAAVEQAAITGHAASAVPLP